MNKAIFLDRDGTINVEKHYLYRIEDFEFIERAVDGLRLLQDEGFLLIIITNQSGIGRGYYTEEDFRKLNEWMIDELKSFEIQIAAVYYCPHLSDAVVDKYRVECDCRKPSLGLFEKAIKDFDIDVSKSYAIGDKIRDCSVCESMDCQGFLIGANESVEIIEQVQQGVYKNVTYVGDLLEAAKKIVEEGK